jgi:hypothetical protein
MSASFLCLCAADHLENLFIIRLRRMCGDAAQGQQPARLSLPTKKRHGCLIFKHCAASLLAAAFPGVNKKCQHFAHK